MNELKARLEGDKFRVLALPFGGPIKGRDLDGEYFTRRTDPKRSWYPEVPVLWHHGQDSLMGDTVIGKAVLDEEPLDDGWWADVWINHGERRAALIKRLAERTPLYGSSGTIGYLKKAAPDGEILVWPYVEQTLTTSPQNTFSVVKSAKAVLDDYIEANLATGALEAAVAFEQAVKADLTPTSDAGAVAARMRLTELHREFEQILRTLRG